MSDLLIALGIGVVAIVVIDSLSGQDPEQETPPDIVEDADVIERRPQLYAYERRVYKPPTFQSLPPGMRPVPFPEEEGRVPVPTLMPPYPLAPTEMKMPRVPLPVTPLPGWSYDSWLERMTPEKPIVPQEEGRVPVPTPSRPRYEPPPGGVVVGVEPPGYPVEDRGLTFEEIQEAREARPPTPTPGLPPGMQPVPFPAEEAGVPVPTPTGQRWIPPSQEYGEPGMWIPKIPEIEPGDDVRTPSATDMMREFRDKGMWDTSPTPLTRPPGWRQIPRD